jgi:hypothetical protein
MISSAHQRFRNISIANPAGGELLNQPDARHITTTTITITIIFRVAALTLHIHEGVEIRLASLRNSARRQLCGANVVI